MIDEDSPGRYGGESLEVALVEVFERLSVVFPKEKHDFVGQGGRLQRVPDTFPLDERNGKSPKPNVDFSNRILLQAISRQ